MNVTPQSRPASPAARRHVPLAFGLLGLAGLAVAATTVLMPAKPAAAAPPATMFNIAQPGFADLVDQVKHSVVSIKVVNGSSQRRHRSRRGNHFGPDFRDFPRSHPFRDYFENFNRQRRGERGRPERRRGRRSMAQGSGFIISTDGYVVTNHHVISKAVKVKVSLEDGKTYDAKIIGTDPKTDLALLKIDADRKFKPVRFSATKARVGDWVVAVGNPFGLGGTVTTGVISARGRTIGNGPYGDYLQIDAAINRGNSGGPTFNLQGEVVGVNTAIYSPSGGSVGIGFAIPANVAIDVIAQLKSGGKVTRGWLGVQIQPVSDDIAESLGLDKSYGAMIVRVTKDSPAAIAGLKSGDTILEVDGNKVSGPRDLARKIARVRPGKKAEIKLLRDGKKITNLVEIKALRVDGRLASLKSDRPTRNKLSGLGLDLRADNDGNSVVIVGIDPDGTAARKGLREGDLIIEVAGAPVKSPDDVTREIERAVKSGRKAVLMLVRSRDIERFIALPLKRV